MKKILSLFALLMTIVIGAKATGYAPTADEVIILNEVYDKDATTTGYSTHAAIAWGGTASTNDKKAGDPNNGGEATSSNVKTFSVKGNSGKDITISITGVSKIIIYHEKHSERYVELRSGSKTGTIIGKGDANTYFTEVELTGTTDYSIFLHGAKASSNDDQDFYVYAIKLIKAASGPVDPVFSVSKTSFGIDETAKILVDGNDNYGANFNNPTTLWETHTGGPYISLGVDGTITPLKKTPEGYGFHFYAGSKDAEKYNSVTSSTLYINITAPVVATPTLTAGGIFTTESKTIEIACETDGATIKYSYDNETWTTYTEALKITETTTIYAKAVKEGSIDSEVANATYTKFVPDPQVDVTGAASWDWSKFGTATIQLTDATTPKKTDEFVLSDIVKYGMCSDISADFGDAQQLKVTTEYVVRDSKYLQGGSIKFNTTVPGIVTVKYTNTGNRSSEDDRRFLNINGTNYGEGTMSSKEADAVTTAVPVSAGEVAIKGTLKKDGSDQYLRFYTITFTPTINVVLGANGYSTFRPGLNVKLASGATVYTAKIQDGAVVLSEVAADAVIGYDEGVILKGTEGETAVFTVVEDEATELDNDLIGANTLTDFDDYTYPYVLASKGTQTSFVKLTADYYDDMFGKAFIVYSGSQQSLEVKFDGATAVEAIAEANEADAEAPVKVIKNGKLFIGNYNVAGQQVK